MQYTKEEVMQYIAEEDVKFIRMAFCDVFGRQKNVSVMPEELARAFSDGIAVLFGVLSFRFMSALLSADDCPTGTVFSFSIIYAKRRKIKSRWKNPPTNAKTSIKIRRISFFGQGFS